ncbi:LOW QUALITY PROTEIN: 28S ribosomal protein S18c, mitochondrial-like [Lacerta agilis]|uniref:LOW QUALITY PROTEIN: 28S ribosomal protein S18c, mitochondrial-like n=1 Tax=Lacerta agilis TaxID=80427 RepID=UPI0014193A2E|nr:LOW QUALITY PROTEIN: 28S ribosomal protein S18c, mitochondrial-like [Lacerta agilis]
MAALAMATKGSGWVFCLFAGVRKGAVSSGAVASWRWGCSSYSEQLSSKADMPVSVDNSYKEPPKKCVLCGVTVDYKNVQLLSQFISPHTGHIFGRHITLTGLCAKKQREVKSPQMGFMSVIFKDLTFLSDPKVCCIKYPE